MATDMQVALRNIVLQLQKDPSRYKCFGVYWWPVKKLLRGAGYTKDQLHHLGDYQDEGQADQVPPAGLEDTLAEAFVTFNQNLQFPHTGNQVEAPDGELINVYDEDAGI